MAPSVKFTEPSGEPLAPRVFSRFEQELAVILTEQPVIDELVDPGLRIIETINRSGAVAVAGDFNPAEVTPIHVYLFPLYSLLSHIIQWISSEALRRDKYIRDLSLRRLMAEKSFRLRFQCRKRNSRCWKK
jgi:hypothetical protein